MSTTATHVAIAGSYSQNDLVQALHHCTRKWEGPDYTGLAAIRYLAWREESEQKIAVKDAAEHGRAWGAYAHYSRWEDSVLRTRMAGEIKPHARKERMLFLRAASEAVAAESPVKLYAEYFYAQAVLEIDPENKKSIESFEQRAAEVKTHQAQIERKRTMALRHQQGTWAVVRGAMGDALAHIKKRLEKTRKEKIMPGNIH